MQMTIPGSEIFASRPLPPDELRRRISPKLELHTVTQEQVDNIDPLTYEVVRHRLSAITQEMGQTLKRMSGSHVVTEANDFDFTICDELGDQVQVGLYNTALVGSMDLAIFWTLEHRSENPGIEEGDMFLLNDPWIGGGLHQNDAAVLAPIFYDGKLFSWSTAIAHQIDVGGSTPGSWSPKAQDVFSESVPTPPLKVVRDGELQRDVADAWVRRSRLPLLLGLDLRAKIGANKTAQSRMVALIDKYGPDTVKAVMKRMMDDAERRLRAKLRSLPNGTWRAVGYQEQSHEGDRQLHEIRLAMTKKDDHLTFDFTGTAPQAGMINCPYPGLRGGVIFMMLPMLAGDIPWAAGGLLRCIDIISEEGTLNNALFPAAVGKGPVGPAWASGNLVNECLAKMLDAKPETRTHVQSVCCGTWDLVVMAGLDERTASPNPFVSLVFDAMAGGYGAQVNHDGVDTGGLPIIPQGRAPDAEMTEFLYPVLFLWRREETDSGGPGRQRGGMSASVCIAGHTSQQTPMGLVVSGSGKATNQNVGLAGGYPGNTQLDLAVRGSHMRELVSQGRLPASLDELGGEREVLPCEGESFLLPGDVVFAHWQAGGGYGDPLRRDPTLVAADVASFRVSIEAAHDIYGVVLDPATKTLDEAATEARRAEILASRRKRAAGQKADGGAAGVPVSDDARLDENLAIVNRDGDELVVCVHCGHEIGKRGENYLENVVRYEGFPGEAGPQVWSDPSTYLDAEVVFRQLCCPSCFTAIQSTVVPADHPVLVDTHEHHG